MMRGARRHLTGGKPRFALASCFAYTRDAVLAVAEGAWPGRGCRQPDLSGITTEGIVMLNRKGRRARARGTGSVAAQRSLALAVEVLEQRWMLSSAAPTRYFLPDGPAPIGWQPTAAMY